MSVSEAKEAGASVYPATRAEHRVTKTFGQVVADPYRWLEQDVRQSPEVQAWVDAQNGVTQSVLKTLPARETFATRIKAIMNFERMGVPRKGGKRYFYTRNNGLQNQSALYVREGVNGEERLLLDPNGWAKDGATALAEWLPSPDGRHLLYAIQDGGTDWRTLRVIDVASGQLLADEVKWVKFSELAWKKDGSGFFYSRFAAPSEGEKYQATNLNQSVWYHAIGTAQAADQQIYATPKFPKRGHSAQVTDDGRYLLITTSEGTDDRYELHVAQLDGARIGTPRPIVSGLTNDWHLAGSVGSLFTFRTDLGAPRGRLVTMDVEAAKPE
ncbi:MAG TPA: S9 family peptidase, partial [Chakrabartia sp.]|nr:S9 family peptidase [Chakrabartia sp.]